MYDILRRAERMNDEVVTELGKFEACCFFASKRLFSEIGPFDADFGVWYGEKDYEIRLLLANKRYGQAQGVAIRQMLDLKTWT
jgi:GT2 family glycosyltransferase